jgi:hypothetical protein
VPLNQLSCWKMLQNKLTVDQIETLVGKHGQVRLIVECKPTVWNVMIQLAGSFNHILRNVDSTALRKMRCQSSSYSANPTSKVERCPQQFRVTYFMDAVHQIFHFEFAG